MILETLSSFSGLTDSKKLSVSKIINQYIIVQFDRYEIPQCFWFCQLEDKLAKNQSFLIFFVLKGKWLESDGKYA